jgi:MFS family permease
MFLSRLQLAQLCLAAGLVLALIAIGCLIAGPIAVAVFCLVLERVAAAAGCALYADTKGYPYLLGILVGVGLGVMGAVILLILPDETREDPLADHERFAGEGIRNARNRDPGYEVLDDEDD